MHEIEKDANMNIKKAQLLERLIAGALTVVLAYTSPTTARAQKMPEVMTDMLATVTNSLAHDEKMAWFREAKYGLFIHWGLYAIPAGVWQGKHIRISSEWIMAHARIPVKEYEQLAKQFNPVDFNADQWVRMAQDAGMKYLVITAKHGDGFAMYHSLANPYNIYDATPFHRDPLRELADACARHGLKLGSITRNRWTGTSRAARAIVGILARIAKRTRTAHLTTIFRPKWNRS